MGAEVNGTQDNLKTTWAIENINLGNVQERRYLRCKIKSGSLFECSMGQ